MSSTVRCWTSICRNAFKVVSSNQKYEFFILWHWELRYIFSKNITQKLLTRELGLSKFDELKEFSSKKFVHFYTEEMGKSYSFRAGARDSVGVWQLSHSWNYSQKPEICNISVSIYQKGHKILEPTRKNCYDQFFILLVNEISNILVGVVTVYPPPPPITWIFHIGFVFYLCEFNG